MLFFLFLQLIIPNQIGCRKTNRGGEGLLKLSIMHAVIISILPSELEVMVILLFQHHFRSCSNDRTINGYCNFFVVLAFDNPEPKRTPCFVFMKRGYCQTLTFLLLSQQTRSKVLFEIFSIVRQLVFTSELMLQFPM